MRLIAEPGEYQVEWQLPAADGQITSLRGDLQLADAVPPRGNAYGAVPAAFTAVGDGRMSTFPQQYEVPIVSAAAVSGLTILLLDARIEIWFDSHAVISARAALVTRAHWAGEVPAVESLTVQIAGLDTITGIAPVGKVKLPDRRDGDVRYLDLSWEAVGNPESTQSWADSAAQVRLSFWSSVTPPNGFFFRVSFSPMVRVELQKPVPLVEAVARWVEPLRRIVTLSTGRQEKITYLTIDARSDTELTTFQVFGSTLHAAPYSSRGDVRFKQDRSFAISPDDMSLLALLRGWQQLEDEHHPLLETYGALLYAPEQHPRNRLLLLVQALEGLHGHETQAAYSARVEEHRQRRTALLREVGNVLSKEGLRFLRRHLASRPASSLQQALSEIVAESPVDIGPALQTSHLVTEVMNDPRKPSNAFDALRLVRNDLAHGTRGYDVLALHEVAEILDGVVRAHLLRILGCSVEAQRHAQERRPVH